MNQGVDFKKNIMFSLEWVDTVKEIWSAYKPKDKSREKGALQKKNLQNLNSCPWIGAKY